MAQEISTFYGSYHSDYDMNDIVTTVLAEAYDYTESSLSICVSIKECIIPQQHG